MLEPGRRRLFLDTLRPPEGYVLDRAVGTTYTLDLMTLLAVPLAFTFSDVQDRDRQIPTEPLSLLESARRYADRIVVFSHGGQTGVPRARQPALAFIEQSVIAGFPPRRGQLRGIFHPKVLVTINVRDPEHLSTRPRPPIARLWATHERTRVGRFLIFDLKRHPCAIPVDIVISRDYDDARSVPVKKFIGQGYKQLCSFLVLFPETLWIGV